MLRELWIEKLPTKNSTDAPGLRTSVLFLCRQPISLMAGLHPVRTHRQTVS